MDAFFAAFCLVSLKAFQQQNVVHSLYIPAFLVSFFLAFAEIGVILSGIKYGWNAAMPIGFGGGIGVVFAMVLHKKVFKKKH